MAVKRTPSWTDAQVKAAMNDVHGGPSISSVQQCIVFHARNSLHNHLTGKSTKRFEGPRLALLHEIENEIVESCFPLRELDFPMTMHAGSHS